ncbi:hypothetical protein CC79DRAFT_1336091 [Sarocladium strictum]
MVPPDGQVLVCSHFICPPEIFEHVVSGKPLALWKLTMVQFASISTLCGHGAPGRNEYNLARECDTRDRVQSGEGW